MTVNFLKNLNYQSLAKSFSLLLLKFDKFLRQVLLYIIGLYRMVLAPHTGGACRFHPSCSEYGIQAYKNHSFLKATKLTTIRILKCNPFGPFGFDPLEKANFRDKQLMKVDNESI